MVLEGLPATARGPWISFGQYLESGYQPAQELHGSGSQPAQDDPCTYELRIPLDGVVPSWLNRRGANLSARHCHDLDIFQT